MRSKWKPLGYHRPRLGIRTKYLIILLSPHMAFLGCGLKFCTHTYTKYDIGPRCTKIKQGAYDDAIYLLIHQFFTHIKFKMSICAHGSLDGFYLVHAKLLTNIMSILSLATKGHIFKLLDLKSKKELQPPIIDISNLSVMILLNSSQKD
jgi:hypothetical protein